MPNLTERILDLLYVSPGLSDREITDALHDHSHPQQAVNATCRQLAQKGLLEWRQREWAYRQLPRGRQTADGRTGCQQRARMAMELSEDWIKERLKQWLEAQGWEVIVTWGRTHGVDVEARKGLDRWILEVKGQGSRPEMRVNYFVGILGELLQRMDDSNAKYSIVLPDLTQFRRLWERLPALAKARIGLTAIFVDAAGNVREVCRTGVGSLN